MDYGKQGSAKPAKKAPKHAEHNAKGSSKNPFGGQSDKAALLERMKAVAEAKKKD